MIIDPNEEEEIEIENGAEDAQAFEDWMEREAEFDLTPDYD